MVTSDSIHPLTFAQQQLAVPVFFSFPAETTMDLQLRTYQTRILASIGNANAILKMPTGSGKTIVAAQLVNTKLDDDNSRAALFLVPTRDLVDQQSSVLESWCHGAQVLRFTGGMADPQQDEEEGPVCIVSTPEAFLSLQKREKDAFGWHAFGIVVFDEVHHVLKEDPYRRIALRLLAWHEGQMGPEDQKVQIIGLSASLTYHVTKAKVTSTLNRLCSELSIEKMVSPSMYELEAGGYVPQHGRNVELERSSEVPEGVLPKGLRKDHLMYSEFMKRVETNTATAFSLKVWSVVKQLEDEAAAADPHFHSPLSNPKLMSWEQHANDMAYSQPWNEEIFRLLETWYTGLRLLVQTWEEQELLVMQWLKMKNDFDLVVCQELQEIQGMAENPENFYRLGRLRFHLHEKRKMKQESFKCVVFVQQRIAAVILSHYINTDPHLQTLGLKSGFVTGRYSKITPSLKVTKRMARDTITQFRSGEINVIVATKVLEEVSRWGEG